MSPYTTPSAPSTSHGSLGAWCAPAWGGGSAALTGALMDWAHIARRDRRRNADGSAAELAALRRVARAHVRTQPLGGSPGRPVVVEDQRVAHELGAATGELEERMAGHGQVETAAARGHADTDAEPVESLVRGERPSRRQGREAARFRYGGHPTHPLRPAASRSPAPRRARPPPDALGRPPPPPPPPPPTPRRGGNTPV